MQKFQKNVVKKVTALLLVVALVFGSSISLMAAEPIRQSFEDAGALVTWDYDSELIIIEVLDSTIILEPDSNIAIIDGVEVELGSPIFVEYGRSFIQMDDLVIISLALLGAEPAEGDHGVVVATAEVLAAQFMELGNAPDFSLAIVNVNNDFVWTRTMSDNTDADTIFHLGSIGKTFTAVAVMQLVEQGLIGLDTPIVEYLPNFSALPSVSGEGDYRNITARMLLSHTSGIYTNDMGAGAITYGGHYERYMNEFLDRFAGTRMVRQEGTAYEYANNGFVILGILVAYVAGFENYFQGFNQYMLENIFEPMGLTRTSYVMTEELRAYVAQPYTTAGQPREFQYWNQLPTGTLFTTANEMVSLMTMLLNGGYYNGVQIITPESIDLMFTDQTGIGAYGLGIAFMPDPAGSGFVAEGHNGSMVYNFAAMFLDREHGVGVFSASNSTTSQGLNEVLAGAVIAAFVTELGGQIIPPVTHIDPDAIPVELSEEVLETLAGIYIIAGGAMVFFVDLIDGQLYLRVPEQGLNLALTPMSDGHFATELGIPFWLIPDGEGNVFFVQGANRYAFMGVLSEGEEFLPDENFMENWYGYTFEAYQEQYFYVIFIPTISFGVTDAGFAYSNSVIINMIPGTTLTMLENMSWEGFELQYEDGEYFFEYWGLRFVRQTPNA